IDRTAQAGVLPHANEPTHVAPQTSDAPGPFARTVRVSAWLDEGASVALGRIAVNGRGGIQSIAWAGVGRPAPHVSAIAKRRRGPANRAGPPFRLRFTGSLTSRW